MSGLHWWASSRLFEFMRIRTIKPDFWQHPVMQRQSDATKLLAIGLLNMADDEGYFFADPKAVRNAIRPNDDDSRITTVSLQDLSKIGFIEMKEHPTHGMIGLIKSFTTHQVINKPKPSKIKHLFDSSIDTVSLPYQSDTEGKGKEQGKEQGMELISCPISSDDSEILGMIWSHAPSSSRERSSKKSLEGEWKKLPKKSKPTREQLEHALKAWQQSQKWKTGYAEGIHRWVKKRQWENIPEPMTDQPNASRPMSFGTSNRIHANDKSALDDDVSTSSLKIITFTDQ